jgi:hypothetical protein
MRKDLSLIFKYLQGLGRDGKRISWIRKLTFCLVYCSRTHFLTRAVALTTLYSTNGCAGEIDCIGNRGGIHRDRSCLFLLILLIMFFFIRVFALICLASVGGPPEIAVKI